MNGSSRSRVASTQRCERGVALIEAAVVIPLMLVVLIVTFELLRVSYIAVSLQFVAERVMRQYVISPMAPSVLQTTVVNSARSLGVNVTVADIKLCRLPNGACATVEATAKGDFVGLTIDAPTNALSWLGRVGVGRRLFQLRTTVLARNEL